MIIIIFISVPQQGALDIQTEFGFLYVPPGQIAVIPRGICFSVELSEPSRGYVSSKNNTFVYSSSSSEKQYSFDSFNRY